MAETFYVDIVESDNIDCVLNEGVELADNVTNIVCVSITAGSTTVFSTVAGVSRIVATNLGGDAFADGAKIIIRGSVASNGINNDGCYTIIDANIGAATISVKEGVVAATSVSATVDFDEFVTFILHPTKRTGQMLVYIEAVSAMATFDVSFEPGGYWAAGEEIARPAYQGSGVASGKYLFQIETARYLQKESRDVAVDSSSSNDVDVKGKILMRVFPGTSTDPILADELNVAFIMVD